MLYEVITDGEFVAFAPHGFDENRQVQFAAAGNPERVAHRRFLHPEGDVGSYNFV